MPLLLSPAPVEIELAWKVEQARLRSEKLMTEMRTFVDAGIKAAEAIVKALKPVLEAVIESARVLARKAAEIWLEIHRRWQEYIERVTEHRRRATVTLALTQWGLPLAWAAWVARHIPKWYLPTLAHLMSET